jgi:hypothetical protein
MISDIEERKWNIHIFQDRKSDIDISQVRKSDIVISKWENIKNCYFPGE